MNLKVAASCLIAGALLLPVPGYSASDGDTDRSAPKAFVKDSVITTKIKARLAAEKLSSLAKIRVDTDQRGVVTLSGRAATQRAADRAVMIAQAVEGVRAVHSNIRVTGDQ